MQPPSSRRPGSAMMGRLLTGEFSFLNEEAADYECIHA
jgi:hypothetical protein